MPPETADEKAHRLLHEGRLIVRTVGDPTHPGRVVAECRGDSGMMYLLGYDAKKAEWRCTCPNMTGNCSHLKALKLVVIVS